MNPKVATLREEATALHGKAQGLLAEFEGKEMPAEKQTELDKLLGQVESKLKEADRLERVELAGEYLNAPSKFPVGLFGQQGKPESDQQPKGPFKSMGEQLMSIKDFATGARRDERLFEVKALGLNEAIGSEGAFLLQPQFTTELWKRAYEVGAFASRCRRFTIGGGGNSLTINAIDETSRATGSRYGGMQSYWAPEGTGVTATKPKFRRVELRLKKLFSLHYATDEELADVATLQSVIADAASEEIAWMLDEGVLNGDGSGKPLGIMASPALVTVAKEAGQVAATVVSENVSKMWARCWARSRPSAVWFINQDVEPQLDAMALTVGLGGVPTYLPPGGLADAPYGRLKGRPVIVVEQCATIGTVGDIVLADLSQYFLAEKGGVQADSSIHVQFLTDEQAFRFIYRCDGQPAWNSALIPAKGTNTLSPFVALAAR